jgi:hypothetical protein
MGRRAYLQDAGADEGTAGTKRGVFPPLFASPGAGVCRTPAEHSSSFLNRSRPGPFEIWLQIDDFA